MQESLPDPSLVRLVTPTVACHTVASSGVNQTTMVLYLASHSAENTV